MTRCASACCFPSRAPKETQSKQYPPQEIMASQKVNEAMETDLKANNAMETDLKKDNRAMVNPIPDPSTNIITNHDFFDGLNSWHPNCCDGSVIPAGSAHHQLVPPISEGMCAVITNRTECWQGLEQDITGRIFQGYTYDVCAHVAVSGPVQGSANVQATLKLEYQNSVTDYLFISRTNASTERWEELKGTFSLSTMPQRIVFYLEGPSAGVDLLIVSVVITCSIPSQIQSPRTGFASTDDDNIIVNPNFENDLSNWSGRGCSIARCQSMGDGKVLPKYGSYFAATTNRTDTWNGIQQEITGRVQRKLAYDVCATVRIYGNNVTADTVRATLFVQTPNTRDQYIGVGTVQATATDWVELKGKFLLNGSPSKVVIYLEGPLKGTDILLNRLVVRHAETIPPSPPPVIENPCFGVNIIQNTDLDGGSIDGWFPLGNCKLSIGTGSPRLLPPMARESLGSQEHLSGHYLLTTGRTQTWMGPAQIITDKLKLFLTYQLSAWVGIGNGASSPQNINLALSVDGQWVNGGEVEVSDTVWHEIGGSFRIEKQPSKVMLYVQGPAPGLDLMVGGLQVFSVDPRVRFRHLNKQIEKIRKRDVTIKLTGPRAGNFRYAFLSVRQTQNSFPIGSCISRTNIENEEFVDFFLKYFNWAVFGNELKWYWTEPQRGNLDYTDADGLLGFCEKHGVLVRGHCIFWEVEDAVQPWVRSLSKTELMGAVQSRLTGLLTRYKGRFRHYDVNNEMLHGSFYQDRLGVGIRAEMFKSASQLDPGALLFVNDYHVEDGKDPRSSPERYGDQVLDLRARGAPVGGIGVQGHIDAPVGGIVGSALDRLGTLGLPVWFTEIDVSSANEHVRADDLEVMLREAFAHPAVEGVMLWGFWELFMSRLDSHLVDAEGRINTAGQRLIALRQEWLSHAHGHITEDCEFVFRGFHGIYTMEILGHTKVSKTFVVEEGDLPLEVSIAV